MVRPDAALRLGLSRCPASRPEPAPRRDREPGSGAGKRTARSN
ncbi:rCG45635, isoform CRA_a [Rattus norvegicus]|uniref:RCG45635, isoform CRA_a n=1 Tax=Rattus norvegicus TaxID=10116 RepID=A6JTU8_RAT|nr:rCG45635, isoform CRA_a [Rattus norvegicus]